MIKFKADTEQGPFIGFGLSRENLKRLKEGRPIVINLAELNLPPGKVMIFYGTTEAAMVKEMLPHINEHTIVHGAESLEQR